MNDWTQIGFIGLEMVIPSQIRRREVTVSKDIVYGNDGLIDRLLETWYLSDEEIDYPPSECRFRLDIGAMY